MYKGDFRPQVTIPEGSEWSQGYEKHEEPAYSKKVKGDSVLVQFRLPPASEQARHALIAFLEGTLEHLKSDRD